MNVISAFAKKLAPEVGTALVQQLRVSVVSNVTDRPLLRLRMYVQCRVLKTSYCGLA